MAGVFVFVLVCLRVFGALLLHFRDYFLFTTLYSRFLRAASYVFFVGFVWDQMTTRVYYDGLNFGLDCYFRGNTRSGIVHPVFPRQGSSGDVDRTLT